MSDRARAIREATAARPSCPGGVQYLGYDYGTGTATSTTIDSGGIQYVGDDYGTGTATSTTISGYVRSSGITADVRAYQYVGDDYGTGTATSTTIDSGGAQYVGYDYGDRDGDEHDDQRRRYAVCRR